VALCVYYYIWNSVVCSLFWYRNIGGSGKQAHSLAGISRKKYWVSGSSETGYRRIFLTPIWRIFVPTFKLSKKKKSKKTFFTILEYKIIDSENFIKVSQNPNKIAGDTQGLPTVPHNEFGGLNFEGLASKYLFLMTTSPYKITFSQKNRTRGTLTSEKTSDSALSGGGAELISGLLFYFAFLLFELQPAKWMALYARSSDMPRQREGCLSLYCLQQGRSCASFAPWVFFSYF